ncbi:hypothetical protein [Exiguobacterium aurantiacum]|uniref:hypothetical protein n=1 Tax=Exiguobacterium aurantiacum TaxID=33987 RepID=UPI003CFFB6BB
MHDREVDVTVESPDEVILRDQLVQRGLRLDWFMSFLGVGAIHIGLLLLMTGGRGVYILLSLFGAVRIM